MSLLLLAMSNRSKNAVLALLNHGANPNLRTELGKRRTPIQPVALAAGGDDSEMLRLLLDHGGAPNASLGATPAIFEADSYERQAQLHLLLDHGADINATDAYGNTLVVEQAILRRFDQVAYLLEKGADAHKANRLGLTVAFELQTQGFGYKPDFHLYPWVVKVKHLLEAQGIRFPVPDPGVAYRARRRAESAQRRQWQTTAEGKQLVGPIVVATLALEAGQPTESYTQTLGRRVQAEKAFQAWRKTQPDWWPSTEFGSVALYPAPVPTPAQEMAGEPTKAELEVDGARWAEQARAIR